MTKNKTQSTIKKARPPDSSAGASFARSACPIANALDLIGDRWSLLLVRDLIKGARSFGELRESPECIATNILAQRLEALGQRGLIEKRLYQERPARYRYALTAKGRDLGPVLLALVAWGKRHVPGSQVMAGIEAATAGTRRVRV